MFQKSPSPEAKLKRDEEKRRERERERGHLERGDDDDQAEVGRLAFDPVDDGRPDVEDLPSGGRHVDVLGGQQPLLLRRMALHHLVDPHLRPKGKQKNNR